MNNEMIIEVNEVYKKYDDATVLDNVSLEIEKGKIYGLVGRNGSGKTVLMKCICGLIKPTSGEVKVAGKTVGKDVDIPEYVEVTADVTDFSLDFTATIISSGLLEDMDLKDLDRWMICRTT